MEFFNELLPFVKDHHILSLAWVALFIAIIYMTIKIKLSKVKTIELNLAVMMINKNNAVLVDIRTADRYKKGHIADSINLLPIDIKNNSIQAIEKYKDEPVILIDDNGLTANASGELLVKQGFKEVYVLKDGIAGWNGSNFPLVKK